MSTCLAFCISFCSKQWWTCICLYWRYMSNTFSSIVMAFGDDGLIFILFLNSCFQKQWGCPSFVGVQGWYLWWSYWGGRGEREIVWWNLRAIAAYHLNQEVELLRHTQGPIGKCYNLVVKNLLVWNSWRFKFNLCCFNDISIFPYVYIYLLVLVKLILFYYSHINLLKVNIVIIVIICIN